MRRLRQMLRRLQMRLGLQLLAQHGKAVAEFRAARGAKSDGSRALEEIRRKLLAMKERDGG